MFLVNVQSATTVSWAPTRAMPAPDPRQEFLRNAQLVTVALQLAMYMPPPSFSRSNAFPPVIVSPSTTASAVITNPCQALPPPSMIVSKTCESRVPFTPL